MTPQQLKAMKMAFEAHCKDERHHTVAETRYWCRQYKLIAQAAIAALAEHAMREVQRLGQEIEQKIGCVNHDCDQCKAQPEQEPVIGKWSLREVYFDEDGEPISHRSPPQRTEQPAQRTWVGLTEDEVALIAADCSLVTPSDFYFYQAIEAKLMEKNA